MTPRERVLRPEHVQVLAVSFLLGLASVAACAISGAVTKAEDALRTHLQVSVSVNPAPPLDAAQLGPQLKTLDSEIHSFTYISKDSALQEAMKDPVLAKSLMLLKDNPLPAVYLLQYSDRAWLTRNDPTQSLHNAPYIQEIRWDPQARSAFRAFAQWQFFLIKFAEIAAGVLVAWLLISLIASKRIGFDGTSRGVAALIGVIGSGIAVGLWDVLLPSLESDATLYRYAGPWWISLIVGCIVGAATLETRVVVHEP